MLIPKIKHIRSNVSLITGVYIATIELESESISDVNIISEAWYTTIMTGTGSIVPNTSGLLGSPRLGNTFTLLVEIDNVTELTIYLKVKDNDNKEAVCSVTIMTNGNPTSPNIWMYGLNYINAILPDGYVEFRPIPIYLDLLGNIPNFNTFVNQYASYEFDATSNGIVDSISTSITTFQSRYSNQCNFNLATLTVSNIDFPINQVYTQASFNPIILNPKELIVTHDSCTVFDLYSQTETYIERLNGRVANNSMKHLTLTINTNCCEGSEIVHRLAPRYNFNVQESNCVNTGQLYIHPNGFEYEVYTTTITLSGIDNNIISTLTYSQDDTGNMIINSNTDKRILLNVQSLVPYSIGAPDLNHNRQIVLTTVSNFTYIINYELQYGYPTVCYHKAVLNNIVYPDLPCGVQLVNSINETRIVLNSAAFNLTSCNQPNVQVPDGIYTFTLNDSGISNEYVSRCIFVNCNTYCLIVKAIANECDIFVKVLYDALVYSDMCDIVTCEEKCYMYEMLVNLLKECDCTWFENNNKLPNISDCNCK